MVVGVAVDTIVGNSSNTGRYFEIGPVAEVFRHDAEKRRLHRAGGNLKGLEEEGVNRDGDADGYQNHFDIFSQGRVRVLFKPPGSGLVEIGHPLPEALAVTGSDCRSERGDCRGDLFHGLVVELVGLGPDCFFDVAAMAGSATNGSREEPA